jgi:uncharacterized SAM-binding protein YcdF (DUF218 family)
MKESISKKGCPGVPFFAYIAAVLTCTVYNAILFYDKSTFCFFKKMIFEINSKPDRIITDITDFIFVSDPPAESDVIFVPGGVFAGLAERAAELYRQGIAPFVIPAGRYSVKNGKFGGIKDKPEIYSGDYATECEFYTDVLQKNGVPSRAILCEDRSMHTRDNAFFSRELCDSAGIKVGRGIICCMSFHARRCLMLYKLAFPEAEILISPVDCYGITRDSWHRSAYGVERVMGELARCGSQFVDDIKNHLDL